MISLHPSQHKNPTWTFLGLLLHRSWTYHRDLLCQVPSSNRPRRLHIWNEKPLVEEEWKVLVTTNEFPLGELVLGQIQACLSIALGDSILGQSACWPRVFCVHLAPLKRPSDTWKASHWPFTYPSKCCFSSSSTTWFSGPQLTPALSHPSTTAHWHQIVVRTSPTAGQSGTLSGAASLRSFPVPGSPSTQMFPARRSEWQTVGLKGVYGIHWYHSPSIVFLCSFVRCLCPNICWHGRLGSSWALGK